MANSGNIFVINHGFWKSKPITFSVCFQCLRSYQETRKTILGGVKNIIAQNFNLWSLGDPCQNEENNSLLLLFKTVGVKRL